MHRRLPLTLTLLATMLQFWVLDAQSLWYDEGFSVWLARKSIPEIVALTAADIQPPLYYLLLHGWMRLAGSSEWAVRWLSAACAVLAVPLAWGVARRLLRQRVAADVAALLVALSPLWLWYGREARNYTLGLALVLAAAWLLLGCLRAPTWRRVVTFGLIGAAGLWTHYFIVFVLVAWAVAVLVGSWLPRRVAATRVGVALALPFVLYLPWLGVIVQRLGADRSYWEGTLDAGAAVEGALASWMVGHAAHEAVAVPLGWLGAALAGAGLLALAARARGSRGVQWAEWLFTAAWLLGPVVGTLLLAWNRPKFSPRYLMFAAPAFLFCLASLVSWVWGQGRGGRWLGVGVLGVLLTVSLYADRNGFTDPAFAKADWRGAAALVAAEQAPGEPVLLVSGHTFPVYEYYDPASAPVRLPDERTLDTTAVLGLSDRARLAEALQGAAGVWLVQWQDEVVDPEGVVPALLRAAGAERLPTPLFQEVRVSHWRLPPGADVAAALDPTHPSEVRFGDALRLVGWSALPRPTPADEGLPLTLFWAAQRPLDGDFKVRLTVQDAMGFEWGGLDQRPTAYLYPTFRWQSGETRLATLDVPLAPGTPPGDYWVTLSVYEEGQEGNLDVLDAAGAPQGQSVRLGPFRVAPTAGGWVDARPPADAMPLDRTLLGQRLLAARLALPVTLGPGTRLPLALWWRAGGPLPGTTVNLGWEQRGQVLEAISHPLDSEAWRAGDLVQTQLALRGPRDLPPGPVRLVAWLQDSGGPVSERILLGESEVAVIDRSFTPPSVATPQQATFGDTIRLLGYEWSSVPDALGTLTLHWEALAETGTSYTRFVHLLDASGRIVAGAGQDALPLEGTRPTDSWLAGEFLTERVTLTLPPDAAPGPYALEVGWYDAGDPTFPRLPASGEGADGSRVVLGVEIRN